MGIGMLGPLVWFGGRAVVAMLIVMALSSVLALRGYRWAALTLFGLALSILALVVAALGYDAFIHKLPPFPPEMFRFWLAEQKRRVFYGAATTGLVAGWYLIQAIQASIARSRLLPPQAIDVVGRMRAWGNALGRFAMCWQAWFLRDSSWRLIVFRQG
jgi:hypothetical protein